MKITIEYETDNEAFEMAVEAQTRLVLNQACRHVLDHVHATFKSFAGLVDINGNRVGEVRVDPS